VAGLALEVEIFGQRHRAVVQAEAAMWDGKNERIRA
jgi:dimethylglycine dehydrogenase